MKSARNFATVLVTTPNLVTARRLAKAALAAKVAACANLITSIESHYWWQGKLERGQEVLLIIKTHKRRLAALEKLVLDLHPYDTPEILALPIVGVTKRYAEWLEASFR